MMPQQSSVVAALFAFTFTLSYSLLLATYPPRASGLRIPLPKTTKEADHRHHDLLLHNVSNNSNISGYRSSIDPEHYPIPGTQTYLQIVGRRPYGVRRPRHLLQRVLDGAIVDIDERIPFGAPGALMGLEYEYISPDDYFVFAVTPHPDWAQLIMLQAALVALETLMDTPPDQGGVGWRSLIMVLCWWDGAEVMSVCVGPRVQAGGLVLGGFADNSSSSSSSSIIVRASTSTSAPTAAAAFASNSLTI
ncbi:MAG: hypothetical protein Q9163_006216 [Psora crenata]